VEMVNRRCTMRYEVDKAGRSTNASRVEQTRATNTVVEHVASSHYRVSPHAIEENRGTSDYGTIQSN
jgi:hypothetical protein